VDYEIEYFVRRPSVDISFHKLETFTAYEVPYIFQPASSYKNVKYAIHNLPIVSP
jgi:hypothetical protein